MLQRGRKGIAELEAPGAVSLLQRPDPPLDLTPEEADEWRDVVSAMPADWFPRETWPLLAQYCRHSVSAKRVGAMIDAEMSRKDLEVYAVDKLLAMQVRETNTLRGLAASMRLAQQSSRTDGSSATAKRKRTVTRLWDG